MFGASSAATGKGAGYLGMVSMLANTPWVQFNPLSLMNANKGVFGVNLGHMWGDFDRMRPWMDQLMGLWENGAIKPKVARVFKFAEAAGGPSFHSGPQEHRQGASCALRWKKIEFIIFQEGEF